MANTTDRWTWARRLAVLRDLYLTAEREAPLARRTFGLAGILGRARRRCILDVGRCAKARAAVARYEAVGS